MAPKRKLGNIIVGLAIVGGLSLAYSKGWLPRPEDGGGTSAPTAVDADRRVASPSTETGEVRTAPPAQKTNAPRDVPAAENSPVVRANSPKKSTHVVDEGARAILEAYESMVEEAVHVETAGIVERTLADDTEGHQHQRFVIRLSNDHTVLIAHNIDVAPRVPLKAGDRIEIKGDYEWNNKGGVVHWTHHDPRERHKPGWIVLDGEKYE